MNTLTKIIVTSLVALLLMSCNFNFGVKGNGNVVETEREISQDFNAINISAGLQLTLTQGNRVSLVVEADENLQDIIKTEVKDNVLKIYTTDNIASSVAKNIFLTAKYINALKTSSGSETVGTNLITTDSLLIDSSSGSEVTLEVKTNMLECETSSGSSIRVSGSSNTLLLDASSGSAINAINLTTKTARVEGSSGSDIDLTVTDQLTASASSGSAIVYYGNPKNINTNDSSSGSVRAKN